ncbi:MAG: DUF4382 domain-containing protein [Gemmatimonadota bacterium]
MFSRTTGVVALALSLTLSMAACDDSTGSPDAGTLTLMLTDAPGDVAHAWVTIDHIYLQPGEEENGPGRVDLMTDDYTVDLLTLANDIEELVTDVDVPGGFYEQLRVVVAEACIAVKAETEGEYDVYSTDSGFDQCATEQAVADNIAFSGTLNTPSMSQTGIKVVLPGEDGLAVTGGQHILLLDFDVAQSFGHVAGESGQWVMHPVIKAEEVGLTSSVTVSVTAAEDLEMPTIDGTALTLGDLVADLSTEEADQALVESEEADGVYTATFSYLVPDPAVTPVVTIQGDGLDVTTEPSSVEVTLVSGQDVQVEMVVTGVTVN